MTKEEIIEMARQAGFEGCAELTWENVICTKELVAFAKLVAEKAIKEALAHPEQYPQIAINPEIVGYVAPQRTWVGLTEEEQLNVFAELIAKPRSEYEVYKAYELALKEKNT